MKDIIIIGNGFIGSVLACALVSKGFHVTVVDALPRDKLNKHPNDGRAFALSPSSYNILNNLGILTNLRDQLSIIETIYTTDTVNNSSVVFNENNNNKPLGYMIESYKLQKALFDHMNNCSHIEWFDEEIVEDIKINDGCASVTLKSGKTLNAHLLIGADGKNSHVRGKTDFSCLEWSYRQKAIVCNVSHALPHKNIAFEHFTAFGPLAFLPLQGDLSGLVWSVNEKRANELMKLSETEFCEELQKNFGATLGKFTLATMPQTYPLSVVLATECIKSRVALVGDAAHAFHPVAGQGLNVGLKDIASLVDVLFSAKKFGLDLGSIVVLEEYQRVRRMEHLLMTLFTDRMIKIFSWTHLPSLLLRKIGMKMIQQSPSIKSILTGFAKGVKGNIPSLAKEKEELVFPQKVL